LFCCDRLCVSLVRQAIRGLYRVHQFSKVEIFAISTPEVKTRSNQGSNVQLGLWDRAALFVPFSLTQSLYASFLPCSSPL